MRNLDGKLKNSRLVVHAELPTGAFEHTGPFGIREARGYVDGKYLHLYRCPRCNGWIEGLPDRHNVNNWAPHALAGRMGTVEDCARCGEELFFSGVMS